MLPHLNNGDMGLRSCPLCKLVCQILLWSQGKLLFLQAAYILGAHNIGADILHPVETGAKARGMEAPPRGGGADMEGDRPGTSGSVCVLRDISLFTLVLAHASSSRLCLYAFPPISLLPGVLERVRRNRVLLLLIAPRWPGRVWFPDIISLLDGPPLELPVRWDLLAQARGSIFHPQPELWNLWAWLLRGPSS